MARQDSPPNFTSQTDTEVQSYLFGGLNTTATPLNTPYEDSPLLQNMQTNIEGSVEKRKGSRVLYDGLGANPVGVTVVPFSSGLNYNLVVLKVGANLEVHEIVNDVSTRVMTKSNVFDSNAINLKASTVRTSESEPRILFFTGTNKPVQLRFAEQQWVQSTGTGLTSVAITSASRFANASPTNCMVFLNRTRIPGASFSYNAGTSTLTVSSLPATTGPFVVDILMPTWQWWAEGMLWKGDRYYKSTTRFNAQPIDQNVAIPSSIRTDSDPPQGSNVLYELTPYKKSSLVVGAAYTYARQPDTATKYTFGDGSLYTYAADNYPNPTPFFFTMGALESPAVPSNFYIIRRRELRLNNNEGILNGNVDVYVNNIKRVWRTSQVGVNYLDYFLHERIADGSGGFQSNPILNALTQPTAYYMSFETTIMGAPGDAKVEVINNERVHIGSAAIATRDAYDDGSYSPIFGIGLYADYKHGYYPSAVELYQGRLALSGFSNAPLTVLFSNTYDSVVPGVFFNFFQVTDDLAGVATDPFDITISSRPDDRLVATVEFQASLFALTRRGVFRIHGGQQAVTITNHFTVFVSSIGCVNNASYVKTDKDILYLSDSGVYNLLPQIENQEYQAAELSIKIRNIFGVSTDPTYENLPWMEFDDIKKLVYVGYPIAPDALVCRRLFVFNTVRLSWTEYTTPSGFQSFQGTVYVDRQLGNGFLLVLAGYRTGSVVNDLTLLKLEHSRYFDFVRKSTGTGVSADYLLPPEPKFNYTTTANQHLYSIDPLVANTVATSQYTMFDTLPVSEIEDAIVTLDGVRLTNAVDFIKTPGNYIYLLVNPPTGKTLTVKVRRPVTDSDAGQALYGVTAATDIGYAVVLKDNELVPTDYTIITNTGRQYARLTAATGAVIEHGQAYMSVYSTPTFTNRSLRALKQRKWVYAYFDNSMGQYLYSASDTNLTAGQLTTAITDTPKTHVNGNMSLVFSSENSGETTADLYGFESLVWDDSLFDINAPSSSFQKFQLFKEPLRGTGYSYQLLIWNYDEATFKLVGYQIDGTQAGKRVVTRFR